MRVLLFTGKGGVGKTSLAAATALAAARWGHRVFLLSTDAAHSLGDVFGRPIGPRPVEVAPGVTAQEVVALAELERSWGGLQTWLETLLAGDDVDVAAEELLVLPGLEELVSLRAIKEVEDGGAHDVCVVDCAPTGSTLRLLRFPDLLRSGMDNLWDLKRRAARAIRPIAQAVGAGRLVAPEEVFDAFEQLYSDVDAVRQILLDEDRTSARLVVNPARVVVDETRRSFAYLCLHGVATDAVLINRVLPSEASHGWFARWSERERTELAEIERSFPVPQFRVPLHPNEPIGAEALGALGVELYGDRDPAGLFVRRRPIRVTKRDGRTLLSIDLPTADAAEVDVLVRGRDLLVGVRDVERRIALPESMVGLPIASADFEDGVLEVTFEPPQSR